MPQLVWDFSGERVLVTGGAGGIGLSIGTAFARAGARVVLLGRDRSALDVAVATVNADAPGHASGEICDLSDPREIARAGRAVTEIYGGVDILVNNAGVGGSVPFLDLSERELDLHLNVNLRATILVTQALIGGMLDRGRGSVINIASQAARRGFPEISHYSASKAGVIGFTMALAVEVAPAVRVNAICPGMVLTKMMHDNILTTSEKKGISYDESYAEWSSGIPMGGMQQSSDVANATLFLASDAAGQITGEALNVSGGQTMH
jgi:NAD(P)-dependent dehydrogenase (short-subunit alcohol dehydrogenase family)